MELMSKRCWMIENKGDGMENVLDGAAETAIGKLKPFLDLLPFLADRKGFLDIRSWDGFCSAVTAYRATGKLHTITKFWRQVLAK